MNLEAFCAWLESQSVAVAIAQSSWLFPAVESLHVIALTLVVGSIAMLDLRLLGLRTSPRVTELAAHLLPFTWSAFAAAVVTGLVLFSSQATVYYDNVPFRLKLVLLAAAGLNMAVFHAFSFREVARWDQAARPRLSARLAGGLSLSLWTGIVFLGRWIAFV